MRKCTFISLEVSLQAKQVKLILLTTVLLISISSIFGQKVEWKEFRSNEGNFSIQFPGEPHENNSLSKGRQFELKVPQKVDSFPIVQPVQFYSVGFQEAPEFRSDLTDAELAQIYDSLMGADDREEGRFIKHIIVNGHAGTEIIVRQDDFDAPFLLIGRMFILKGRLYFVYGKLDIPLRTKFDPVTEGNLRKFVDSFSFIN